jgi:hypothetical protein
LKDYNYRKQEQPIDFLEMKSFKAFFDFDSQTYKLLLENSHNYSEDESPNMRLKAILGSFALKINKLQEIQDRKQEDTLDNNPFLREALKEKVATFSLNIDVIVNKFNENELKIQASQVKFDELALIKKKKEDERQILTKTLSQYKLDEGLIEFIEQKSLSKGRDISSLNIIKSKLDYGEEITRSKQQYLQAAEVIERFFAYFSHFIQR